MDGKKVKGKMHNFDENEFKCYQQYEILPENLNSIAVGNIDISSYYQIPIIEEHFHTMTYIPQMNEDALRVIVDRPSTKISIYKEGSPDSITSSFSFNYG